MSQLNTSQTKYTQSQSLYSNIRLKRNTIDRLKKQGAYGMTLDDIVCQLLSDRARERAKGGNN
jgi:hypothetical protein